MTEQRDPIPATPDPIERTTRPTVECPGCGRIAAIVCLNCHPTCGDAPKKYTADQVEEAVMRWCGFPAQTIENVRHALAMEATGGIDRTNQETPK